MIDDSSVFGAKPDNLDRLLRFALEPPEAEKNEPVPTASLDTLTEKPGGRIDNYKLLRVLGEGGMGIVYLAQQEEPVRRQVALKVIKPGMDSKRVIARFEAEKQALALMQHPNIASVYDAGLTLTARPYFVMEYVKGLPITDYCDHHKLTIEERLNLFMQVCQAVQHAHQKGIIHRDIKPSNILVSVENDRAIPKIIDFGVAKAISQPLTERTLQTEESQLLGTPEYMSPEQADMASEDIDTRSDVYSLGVLLYVLLTGVLPFDPQTLRDSGIENIRKMIRETDPKTPSNWLTSLGEEAEKVAEMRSTEISTLAKNLKKELEWIPLKAMRKERAERYRSASELSDDVENYLKGEPLIAGPPSTIYRAKKFVRRHKSLVTGIAAVLVVLIVGIIVSTIFALQARRQAQRSDAIVEFLTTDVLGSATQVMGRDATAIDLLDAATAKLDEGVFKDQPLTELLVRYRLGNLIKELGYPKKAIPHLERVQEIYVEQGEPSLPKLPSLHLIMNYLGLAYSSSGELEKAESLFQTIVQEKEKTNHIHTDLYPWSKLVLAGIYQRKGQYEKAERIYSEVSHPQFRNGQDLKAKYFCGAICGLAEIYQSQGRYEQAGQMITKLQAYMKKTPVKQADKDLNLKVKLASLCSDLGRYQEAEDLFKEVIGRSPRERPGIRKIPAMSGLAALYVRQARYKDAESLLLDVYIYNCRTSRRGPEHPHTIKSLKQLIELYEVWGKPEEADKWRATRPPQ